MLIFIARLPDNQNNSQAYMHTETVVYPENAEGEAECRAKVNEFIDELSSSDKFGPPDSNSFTRIRNGKFTTGLCAWSWGAFIEVKQLKIRF